jgi:hypothetical protein
MLREEKSQNFDDGIGQLEKLKDSLDRLYFRYMGILEQGKALEAGGKIVIREKSIETECLEYREISSDGHDRINQQVKSFEGS